MFQFIQYFPVAGHWKALFNSWTSGCQLHSQIPGEAHSCKSVWNPYNFVPVFVPCVFTVTTNTSYL